MFLCAKCQHINMCIAPGSRGVIERIKKTFSSGGAFLVGEFAFLVSIYIEKAPDLSIRFTCQSLARFQKTDKAPDE